MTSLWVCSESTRSAFSLNLLYVLCRWLCLKLLTSTCSVSWDSPESKQWNFYRWCCTISLWELIGRDSWIVKILWGQCHRGSDVMTHEYSLVINPATLRFCEFLWLDSSTPSSISVSWESPEIRHKTCDTSHLSVDRALPIIIQASGSGEGSINHIRCTHAATVNWRQQLLLFDSGAGKLQEQERLLEFFLDFL